MSINESLILALEIMAIGMLLVFAFLGVLILGINLVASCCSTNKYTQPDEVSKINSSLHPYKLAAITAAVHQHRTA